MSLKFCSFKKKKNQSSSDWLISVDLSSGPLTLSLFISVLLARQPAEFLDFKILVWVLYKFLTFCTCVKIKMGKKFNTLSFLWFLDFYGDVSLSTQECVHVYHSYNCFKKIFINFKIILDWSLLFAVFLVNGSEFPSVLYVEWVWIVSWTFWILFSETLSPVKGPLRTLVAFLRLGRQSAHLGLYHFGGWFSQCQSCFPTLGSAALGPLHAFLTLGFISDAGGGLGHRLILKACVGFLCVCVTKCTVGRHWFIHSIRGPPSPDLSSLDFPSTLWLTGVCFPISVGEKKGYSLCCCIVLPLWAALGNRAIGVEWSGRFGGRRRQREKCWYRHILQTTWVHLHSSFELSDGFSL